LSHYEENLNERQDVGTGFSHFRSKYDYSTCVTFWEFLITAFSIFQRKFGDILIRKGVGEALQHKCPSDRWVVINNLISASLPTIARDFWENHSAGAGHGGEFLQRNSRNVEENSLVSWQREM
jgi:hypothetical protein